jgi:hypothetical protein
MTRAKPGAFPSLKMASLNFLMTLLKQQDGKQEPPFTGILKTTTPSSSVMITENLKEISLDFQKLSQFQTELSHRMTLNKLAYMGNPELNKSWIEGYNQAINDMKQYIDQNKPFY